MAPSPATRLQFHRRKAGLTQREVADIIGLASDVQVFRYEKGLAIPSLLVAIAFSVLFQTSIAELFPGLYEVIQQSVESNVNEFERRLQQSKVKGRAACIIAHKLEWVCMRQEHDISE